MPNRKSVSGSGSYFKAFVLCPFYKRDENKTIVCEGFVEDSSICLSYRYNRLYRQQMEIFCCKDYKKCEVYRMLMEKYQD